MSRKIVFFNVAYYVIFIVLIELGRDDPSSSLGYGYFIIVFWALAAIILILLLVRKVIQPKSLIDRFGIFTATPIISLIGVIIFLSFKENVSSEEYFNKNNYRYKRITFDNGKFLEGKRVEYYRSIDTVGSKNTGESNVWIKDSTWIYLSKKGDTIKSVKYVNGIELK